MRMAQRVGTPPLRAKQSRTEGATRREFPELQRFSNRLSVDTGLDARQLGRVLPAFDLDPELNLCRADLPIVAIDNSAQHRSEFLVGLY